MYIAEWFLLTNESIMSFRVLYVHIGMLLRVLNECGIHYTRLGSLKYAPNGLFMQMSVCYVILSLVCNACCTCQILEIKTADIVKETFLDLLCNFKNVSHLEKLMVII